MTPPARTASQRKHDALSRLDRDIDAWVATAGPGDGAPHLVPLSFLWDGTTMLIATPATSVTSRNLQATGRARLGIGPTRDVVLIEGTVDAVEAATDIPAETGDALSPCRWAPLPGVTRSACAPARSASAGWSALPRRARREGRPAAEPAREGAPWPS